MVNGGSITEVVPLVGYRSREELDHLNHQYCTTFYKGVRDHLMVKGVRDLVRITTVEAVEDGLVHVLGHGAHVVLGARAVEGAHI